VTTSVTLPFTHTGLLCNVIVDDPPSAFDAAAEVGVVLVD
jgi:hypothetical protein